MITRVRSCRNMSIFSSMRTRSFSELGVDFEIETIESLNLGPEGESVGERGSRWALDGEQCPLGSGRWPRVRWGTDIFGK